MVIENIGLGFCNRKIVWEYFDFYSRWNGRSTGSNENVWIVPGTIEDF